MLNCNCDTASDHANDASPIASRPVCSSHYDRQLIYYSFILALNGQEFDTRDGLYKLKIDPKVPFNETGDCIVLLLPHASSVVCVNNNFKINDNTKWRSMQSCFDITVMFGRLVLHQLYIGKKRVDLKQTPFFVEQHGKATVCLERKDTIQYKMMY